MGKNIPSKKAKLGAVIGSLTVPPVLFFWLDLLIILHAPIQLEAFYSRYIWLLWPVLTLLCIVPFYRILKKGGLGGILLTVIIILSVLFVLYYLYLVGWQRYIR